MILSLVEPDDINGIMTEAFPATCRDLPVNFFVYQHYFPNFLSETGLLFN
jgi:hypothetical protein